MSTMTMDRETIKNTFKEAISETLREERDLLHDVFAEVLEDVALTAAIREGRRTELAAREEVFAALEGDA
ncbi:MAG: hypothetical protein AUJ92_15385 [Armatimonadetes bacterium CG2_30_59_28]|nr:hypothetical protein [Armatimonadota bacterium]OIO91901.1 MAG: hypothetical protein AUJ92_15385 [Armatimonadetes bacterium CG2_30_59_28]PIU65490.1 MAG: hypothetical protein COS85_08595 [Armatimonadetes bacterium CG07_land_8_20_14_0_80_59_28]PIX44970.1 MAG: hypothetical protein COZ56_03140 [Armatimonadetes bacterium CG_4_8_14_3_um_filter_58_9]PIY37106.1 MAG: hypothetical protein COZ05_22960 [Armatimonadetes bacterium CG_4_10_14_3_um_filter_59_10]PJB63702.1 MAG: hypothetical protein CO095_159